MARRLLRTANNPGIPTEGSMRRRDFTNRDIYRGVVPFVTMQLMALVLVFVFPRLSTWLPKAIGW
jgi:TRAP-type mannitol/chloroaromatic compound transport system permease large subunit